MLTVVAAVLLTFTATAFALIDAGRGGFNIELSSESITPERRLKLREILILFDKTNLFLNTVEIAACLIGLAGGARRDIAGTAILAYSIGWVTTYVRMRLRLTNHPRSALYMFVMNAVFRASHTSASITAIWALWPIR